MEKHFCIQCKHHFYKTKSNPDRAWNNLCDINPTQQQNYVTGKIDIDFHCCENLNLNGNCPDFEAGDSGRCLNP